MPACQLCNHEVLWWYHESERSLHQLLCYFPVRDQHSAGHVRGTAHVLSAYAHHTYHIIILIHPHCRYRALLLRCTDIGKIQVADIDKCVGCHAAGQWRIHLEGDMAHWLGPQIVAVQQLLARDSFPINSHIICIPMLCGGMVVRAGHHQTHKNETLLAQPIQQHHTHPNDRIRLFYVCHR